MDTLASKIIKEAEIYTSSIGYVPDSWSRFGPSNIDAQFSHDLVVRATTPFGGVKWLVFKQPAELNAFKPFTIYDPQEMKLKPKVMMVKTSSEAFDLAGGYKLMKQGALFTSPLNKTQPSFIKWFRALIKGKLPRRANAS